MYSSFWFPMIGTTNLPDTQTWKLNAVTLAMQSLLLYLSHHWQDLTSGTLQKWFSREAGGGSVCENLHCWMVFRVTLELRFWNICVLLPCATLTIILCIEGYNWQQCPAICEWSRTIPKVDNRSSELHPFLLIPTLFLSLDNFKNNLIDFSPYLSDIHLFSNLHPTYTLLCGHCYQSIVWDGEKDNAFSVWHAELLTPYSESSPTCHLSRISFERIWILKISWKNEHHSAFSQQEDANWKKKKKTLSET